MTVKARPNLLPSLDPIGGTKGKPMKVFEANKPIKIMQNQSASGESPADIKQSPLKGDSLPQQQQPVSPFG